MFELFISLFIYQKFKAGNKKVPKILHTFFTSGNETANGFGHHAKKNICTHIL